MQADIGHERGRSRQFRARLLLSAGRHPVQVFDATGRLCMQQQVSSDGVTPNILDLTSLQPGSYWVCTKDTKASRVFIIH